jgi:hypothetical protein
MATPIVRSVIFFVLVLGMAACKTISPCDFAPSSQGWKPINSVPEDLVQIAGRVDSWYINDKRQYLACLNKHGTDLCGGNYLVYGESDAGYVRKDLVVCTSE